MRRLPPDAHGRGLWIHHACRCAICHEAVRAYARDRRAVEAVLSGRSLRTRVPAARARRHVLELVASGFRQADIARAAAVAPSTVSELVHGRRMVELDVDVRLRAVTASSMSS